MRAWLSAVVAFAVWTSLGPVRAAEIVISPAQVIEGDPVAIAITGLPAGATVRLHAQSVAPTAEGKRRSFYAAATFKASSAGAIDLATAVPLSGSYAQADIHGLFWSQRLVGEGSPEALALASLPLADVQSLAPHQVVLTLESGGKALDRKMLTLVQSPDNVVRENVRADGLVGALYTAKGAGKRPVVVILSGSEGGLSFADWLGPKLAAHGFTAFGLAYFAPPQSAIDGVPTALHRVPVELIEKARAWLATRPEADVARFGIVGGSKGGEFALVLAATYEWIDVAVAFVPADMVWQGFQFRGGETGMGSSWTRGGVDLPFLPETGLHDEIMNGRKPGGEIRLARVHKATLAAATPQMLAAARIPIERSHAALLLAGGDDDQTGDSGASVRRAAETLRRAHYAHPLDVLVFPRAGHGIVASGWTPTTTHNEGPFKDGGTAQADAEAQVEGWTHMMAMLKRELGE